MGSLVRGLPALPNSGNIIARLGIYPKQIPFIYKKRNVDHRSTL